MNSAQLRHREKANRTLLYVLLAHIPVLTVLSLFGFGSPLVAVLATSIVCAVPGILTYSQPRSMAASIAIASAMMGMSMILIYQGEGKIEYHFHVFSFLAVLCYLASPLCMLVAAGTIAVHHVAGWWLVPSALFNYAATLGDVAVHALFVVVETAICCVITQNFAENLRKSGIMEEQVALGSDQVAQGAREIASFVEVFARSAATQANMVDQVTDESKRMSNEIRSNLANAGETHAQMVSTVDEIISTHERLDRINDEMQAVAHTSRRISGIVGLMKDIARQTNILAVNASIEASRSGNLGGGFGVIADQVRDLAVRTSEAAAEIDSLLSDSAGKVESSADAVQTIAEKFGRLASATNDMRSLLDSVNKLSRTQVESIERISGAMNQISDQTQHFAAGAEESAGTSSHLSDLASQLRETVNSLR